MKDCGKNSPLYSYITQISTGGPRFDDYTRHFYVFNNIFYDTAGTMRPYGWKLSGGGSGNNEDWETGNNCFYNAGQPLTYESDTPDPTTEAGATYGDPHLSMTGADPHHLAGVGELLPAARGTPPRIACSRIRVRPPAGASPVPNVIFDIEGHPRPSDSTLGHRPL